MFKMGLLFGLGLFIAKGIVEEVIPEIIGLFTNGFYTNLYKKTKSGEIETVSEAINYAKNYVETDPNKTENKIKKEIGF